MKELVTQILKDYPAVKKEVRKLDAENFSSLSSLMIHYLKEKERTNEDYNMDSIEAFLLDLNETTFRALLIKMIQVPLIENELNKRMAIYQHLNNMSNVYFTPHYSKEYGSEMALTEEEMEHFKEKTGFYDLKVRLEKGTNYQRLICKQFAGGIFKEIALEVATTKTNASLSVYVNAGFPEDEEKRLVETLYTCLKEKIETHKRFRLKLLTGAFVLTKI